MVKVSIAQISPVYLNKEKTIEKRCKIIKEASKNGAKLVVFPEAFVSGYPDWIWITKNSEKALLDELYLKLWESSVSMEDESMKKIRAKLILKILNKINPCINTSF